MRIMQLVILLVVTICLKAQDGKRMFLADMDSMRIYTGATGKLNAELVVINKGVENFIPEIKAEIHKDGALVYYKVLHLEYLFAEKNSVIVNHKSRTIAYTTKDGKVEDIFPSIPNMDSLAAIYDSVNYVGAVKGSRKYEVFCSKYYISKIELYYNPATHFVSKLIYHYNQSIIGEDAVVTVEYRNVDLNPSFRQNEFSESRFIMQKGKQFVPAAVLEGYTVSEAKTSMGKY